MEWGDITLNQYYAIKGALDSTKGKEDIDILTSLIGAVYGMTVKEVEELPYKTVQEYAASLYPLLNYSPKANICRKSYKVGEWDCVVELDAETLTTAQYVEFKNLASRTEEMFGEFLSIILMPKGHKWNDGYDRRQLVNDIYEHFKVEDAMALSAFFFEWLRMSIKFMLRRLRWQIRLMRKGETKEAMKQVYSSLKAVGCAYGLNV